MGNNYAVASDIFDDYEKGQGTKSVKAIWFSGKLHIPLGESKGYLHGGYGMQYEEYLVYQVEKGNVIKKGEMTKEETYIDINPSIIKKEKQAELLIFLHCSPCNGYTCFSYQLWSLLL